MRQSFQEKFMQCAPHVWVNKDKRWAEASTLIATYLLTRTIFCQRNVSGKRREESHWHVVGDFFFDFIHQRSGEVSSKERDNSIFYRRRARRGQFSANFKGWNEHHLFLSRSYVVKWSMAWNGKCCCGSCWWSALYHQLVRENIFLICSESKRHCCGRKQWHRKFMLEDWKFSLQWGIFISTCWNDACNWTPGNVKETVLNSMNDHDGHLRVQICTVACGMGVDAKGVWTIGPSRNLECYIQESGRCSGDGQWGNCIILYLGRMLSSCAKDIRDYV